MKTLDFTTPHHLPTLSEELIAAVPALAPTVRDDDEREASFYLTGGVTDELALDVPDDADEGAIAAVVAAHDPAAGEAAETLVTSNEQAIRDALEGRLETLAQARDALAAGTIFAGLSAGEKAVLRLLIRDDLGLIRLTLRRLEATE